MAPPPKQRHRPLTFSERLLRIAPPKDAADRHDAETVDSPGTLSAPPRTPLQRDRDAGALPAPNRDQDQPTTHPRTMRRSQTRAKIRAAARSLVEQHGLEQVTVRMISQAAGISLRTFFNHVPSKNGALIAEQPRLPDPVFDRFHDVSARRGVCAAIEEVLVLHARALLAEQPDLAETCRLARHNDAVAAMFTASFHPFERQLKAVLAVEPDDADLVAATATAALRVALCRWSELRNGTSLQAQIRSTIRGIAARRTGSPQGRASEAGPPRRLVSVRTS